LKSPEGKYILGAKPQYYPKGIYRLLGGGIDAGETIQGAVIREIKEETNSEISAEHIEPIATINVTAEDGSGNNYSTVIELVYINDAISDYEETDEIGSFLELNDDEFKDMIAAYEGLTNDSQNEMNWGDYGKIYAE